jgi:redox-sensing transcriptional repressor
MGISRNSIIRLSRYKSALTRLRLQGAAKVFSDGIADAVGVTAAQVRKDFSIFGLSGNKRAGYDVDALIERLNAILGKNEIQDVVIVGAGNIGQALMKYKGFEREGIRIVAAFDIDTAVCRDRTRIPVWPLAKLSRFVSGRRIKIGIIAVPEDAAQEVAGLMFKSGIKGILNFAPLRLRGPESSVINNETFNINNG